MTLNCSEIKKILVIQFRPFGDVLLATSYLEALRKSFPRADIDFLVKEPYQEVLDKNPYLSNVISFPQERGMSYFLGRMNLIFDIRRRKYDLIINQQNGVGSGQVVLFSGARYRLGWMDGKWKAVYNLKGIKGAIRYSASQNFDMLHPLGIKEQPYELFCHIRPESTAYIRNWLKENRLIKKDIICIAPGSPRVRKKWDIQRYVRLTDLILEHTQCTVVILWAPNELEDAQAIISHTRKKPLLAPPTNYNQAAAFLKECKLLVCNDGGLNHLSVAEKTPSLAIFGNTSPEVWSPEGVFPHHYHLYNPDWERMSDNSFGIAPEEVFCKVQDILKEV